MSEAHTKPSPRATLTPAQWAGLARLGDLGCRLGETVDGGLVGGILADGLDRLGPLATGGKLTATTTALVDAIDALHRAGLLDWIRDNAEFVSASLDTLVPPLEAAISRLGKIHLETLGQEVSGLIDQIHRLTRLADFIEQTMGGELADNAVRIAEFVQQEGTEAALRDMLVQLGRLHRSGLLAHAGALAETAAAVSRDLDIEPLAEALAESRPATLAEQILDWLQAVRIAVAEAERETETDAPGGGVGGLFKLLRDAEVQRSLYLLLRLPRRIETPRLNGIRQSA